MIFADTYSLCRTCRNSTFAFFLRLAAMFHHDLSETHFYGAQSSSLQAIDGYSLHTGNQCGNYKNYLLDLVASSLQPRFPGTTSANLILGVFVATSIYLSIVHKLRFRAIRKLEKQYGSAPEEFKSINYKDAQAILANLFLLEAPWVFLTAKDFAFLRVSFFYCT